MHVLTFWHKKNSYSLLEKICNQMNVIFHIILIIFSILNNNLDENECIF